MARRVPNQARKSARLLTASGALGGLLALLGTWLALRGPHSSLENPSGGGELVMMLGLIVAAVSGFVALSRFGFGLIRKLDRERRPVRLGVKGPH
ncbi:MAG TPA: hypothetical protein VHV51_23940 [Polyangiaceae bacterium]|jgi:hypothetical protein|nr:hypothetical protein [Polyangiaceae bacterium]